MFENLSESFKNWLLSLDLSEKSAKTLVNSSEFLLVLLVAWLSYFAAKWIIFRIVHSIVKRSATNWDDIMMRRKVFTRLAYLIPLLILNLFLPFILADYELVLKILLGTTQVLIVFTVVSIVSSLINSFNDIYSGYEISKTRPIKSYIQVIMIIIYILSVVAIIYVFLGKDGFGWIAGFGAFSAILMLVFKDPILGFVGGIQLTANNMVRIGDWISMPKFGADGNVIDITLTTVKVQNWDKTITTIPTYALVTDYFQNWRGMEESGGRRIKRSINIDMTSVKFCDREMLNRLKRIQFVSKYIEARDQQIEEYNRKHNIDNSVLVNGRRQTNLGIFREYLKQYLRNKPEVRSDMTFLVRQLQPTENGIPIEIYVFSGVQEWAKYEDIQSDVFDHVLAVIPHFDLRVFQNPSGSDFKSLTNNLTA